MRPLYIFDLDGTLADCEHRQHLVKKPEPDWRAFFAACPEDKPIAAVINTMARLAYGGADIWIFSGRSVEVAEQTVAWMNDHVPNVYGQFRMRGEGDFTPDNDLKLSWLNEMSADDRARLVAVFDDRDKVVAMWRAAGVPCFQVAPGAF